MNPRAVFAPSLLLILVLAPLAAAGPDAATAAENDREIVLRNGRLTLTLAKKSGDLTSIRCEKDGKEIERTNGKDGRYFDADGAGHFRPTNGAECRVVRVGDSTVNNRTKGPPPSPHKDIPAPAPPPKVPTPKAPILQTTQGPSSETLTRPAA